MDGRIDDRRRVNGQTDSQTHQWVFEWWCRWVDSLINLRMVWKTTLIRLETPEAILLLSVSHVDPSSGLLTPPTSSHLFPPPTSSTRPPSDLHVTFGQKMLIFSSTHRSIAGWKDWSLIWLFVYLPPSPSFGHISTITWRLALFNQSASKTLSFCFLLQPDSLKDALWLYQLSPPPLELQWGQAANLAQQRIRYSKEQIWMIGGWLMKSFNEHHQWSTFWGRMDCAASLAKFGGPHFSLQTTLTATKSWYTHQTKWPNVVELLKDCFFNNFKVSLIKSGSEVTHFTGWFSSVLSGFCKDWVLGLSVRSYFPRRRKVKRGITFKLLLWNTRWDCNRH